MNAEELLNLSNTRLTDPDALNSPEIRYAQWSETRAGFTEKEIDRGPDGVQQFGIEFDVLIGDWVIGTDRGILWFDDQFLYVVGERTSFAVPGFRLYRGLKIAGSPIRPFQRRFKVAIGSQASIEPGIQFDFQNHPPYIPSDLAVKEAVDACFRCSQAGIEGQLPPFEPALSAHTLKFIKRRLLRSYGLGAAGLGASVLAVALLVERLRIGGLPLIALFFFIVIQIAYWIYPDLQVAAAAARSARRFKFLSGSVQGFDSTG